MPGSATDDNQDSSPGADDINDVEGGSSHQPSESPDSHQDGQDKRQRLIDNLSAGHFFGDDGHANTDDTPPDDEKDDDPEVDEDGDIITPGNEPDKDDEPEDEDDGDGVVDENDDDPVDENDEPADDPENEDDPPEKEFKPRSKGAKERIEGLVRENKSLRTKSLYKDKLDSLLAEKKIEPKNWDWWVETGFQFNDDPVQVLSDLAGRFGLQLTDPRQAPPAQQTNTQAEIDKLKEGLNLDDVAIAKLKELGVWQDPTTQSQSQQPPSRPQPQQAPQTQQQEQPQTSSLPSLAREDDLVLEYVKGEAQKFARTMRKRYKDSWTDIAAAVDKQMETLELAPMDWLDEMKRLSNKEIRRRSRQTRPKKKQPADRTLRSTQRGEVDKSDYKGGRESLINSLSTGRL